MHTSESRSNEEFINQSFDLKISQLERSTEAKLGMMLMMILDDNDEWKTRTTSIDHDCKDQDFN